MEFLFEVRDRSVWRLRQATAGDDDCRLPGDILARLAWTKTGAAWRPRDPLGSVCKRTEAHQDDRRKFLKHSD